MKNFQAVFAVTTIAMMTAITTPAYAVNLGDLFSGANNNKQEKFLSIDKAFKVNPAVQGNSVSVTFNITKGHYIYRDKLKLTLPTGVVATDFVFDKSPDFVEDPKFGKVAVFDQRQVTATTTLSNQTDKAVHDAPISLKWQGCAKAGLCYPPEKVKFNINLKKKVNR